MTRDGDAEQWTFEWSWKLKNTVGKFLNGFRASIKMVHFFILNTR